MPPRFNVDYGDQRGARFAYCVWCQAQQRVWFTSDSKSEVIRMAQRLNNFSPVDGDETTYGNQVAAWEAARLRRRRGGAGG